MPLTGKYLKYSPKITLEIFTLVWDKLYELEWKCRTSIKLIYEEFSGDYNTILENNNTNHDKIFLAYKKNERLIETTVQEILGYDPFVKDDFVLPEKWSVGSYVVFLKNNLQNNSRKIGDISKIKNVRTNAIDFEDNISNNIDGDFSVVTNLKWFATKFEAEEFAKTLVEPVKDVIQLTTFPIEGYCKTDSVGLRKYLTKRPNTTLSGEPKWIEGKSIGVGWNERSHWIISEKSSKPEYQLNQLEKFFTKEGIKQPSKQAVHCKTQEEWDFVNSKINFTSRFGLNSCVRYLDDGCTSSIENFKQKYTDNYQILSFQEWCDLNGYKMENKCELEVGKWYKLSSGKLKLTNPNWYIKYKECEDNIIYVSEYINNKNIYVGGYRANFGKIDDYKFTLITISEIQQYLPDNHPDKIQKFKVGDWVTCTKEHSGYNGKIGKLYKLIEITENSLKFDQRNALHPEIVGVRHATPEEINNHLSSIGQIPDLIKQEPEKYPFKPLKPGDLEWEIQVPQIKTHGIIWCEPAPMTKDNWKNKMILSIDEELPMVSVVKTNTIKQLLSND